MYSIYPILVACKCCILFKQILYSLEVNLTYFRLSQFNMHRADSRFAPSQWETLLQSNRVSHWLGANLESVPILPMKYTHGFVVYNFVVPCFLVLVNLLDTLTHLPWTKWPPIWQTTFSVAISWMKMIEFWLKFHWNMFPGVELTISQHWFRQWLCTDQATSHYCQCWSSSLTHICGTRGRWVD